MHATLKPSLFVGRSVGWLVGWMVGWLVGWLISQLVGQLVSLLVGRLQLDFSTFLVVFCITASAQMLS